MSHWVNKSDIYWNGRTGFIFLWWWEGDGGREIKAGLRTEVLVSTVSEAVVTPRGTVRTFTRLKVIRTQKWLDPMKLLGESERLGRSLGVRGKTEARKHTRSGKFLPARGHGTKKLRLGRRFSKITGDFDQSSFSSSAGTEAGPGR